MTNQVSPVDTCHGRLDLSKLLEICHPSCEIAAIICWYASEYYVANLLTA